MSKDNIDLRDVSTIKNLNISKTTITDPKELSQKVVNEKETRKNFLSAARQLGCEKEMFLIFAKYDKLIKNCTNEKERQDISKLGVLEVYRLLGGGGELYVNGQLIVKDD
jgi:hypothetical protein